MLKPFMKIRIKNGKIKVSAEAKNAAEIVEKKLESTSNTLGDHYKNVLIESYLKDVDSTIKSIFEAFKSLIIESKPKEINDAYIILEDDEVFKYDLDIYISVFRRKITLSIGYSAFTKYPLSKIFDIAFKLGDSAEGFTFKIKTSSNHEEIVRTISMLESTKRKFRDITIKTENSELLKNVIQNINTISYLQVYETKKEPILRYNTEIGLLEIYENEHIGNIGEPFRRLEKLIDKVKFVEIIGANIMDPLNPIVEALEKSLKTIDILKIESTEKLTKLSIEMENSVMQLEILKEKYDEASPLLESILTKRTNIPPYEKIIVNEREYRIIRPLTDEEREYSNFSELLRNLF
ncbi:MAG: hypothetical protein ACP6IP_01520 [Candidatus Njordarchaeia archaeon]